MSAGPPSPPAAEVVREVVVVNDQGLHARPSNAVVVTAGSYDATVVLEHDGRRADTASILSVMTLGAVKGARVRIEASGPEARVAADAVAALFENGFAEMA